MAASSSSASAGKSTLVRNVLEPVEPAPLVPGALEPVAVGFVPDVKSVLLAEPYNSTIVFFQLNFNFN